MRILYITTIGPTMGFFKSFIYELIKKGDTVDIAANVALSDVPKYYREWNCKVYPLPCTRSPFDKGNLQAIKEIRRIVKDGNYDLVHCHTPIAGICTRLACKPLRRTGLKVFYTAHGFHFYKGAPLKNWLLYYPVEWVCAHWTDVLITINKEDYARAKKHMHAKRVEYIPGVGIDLKKFAPGQLTQKKKDELRASIGVGNEDKLLLSVGELIERKNQEAVICAIAKLADPHLKYCICGTGRLEAYLNSKIKELNLTDSVRLLGFRQDISELCESADLFVFPSFQEGLSVALMEAIASKTPVICSNIRGNTDLVGQRELFECTDIDGIARKIQEYIQNDYSEEVERNYKNLKKYDLNRVISNMEALYLHRGGVKHLNNLYEVQLLRQSIGVPNDAFLLLSVGELNHNKNHELVIRALAQLKNPSIYYVVAGNGELYDYLTDLAKSLGINEQVRLLGFRDDVQHLYQAADLYIHPSLREGLPVALMEAIASKLPVICSNIRGNADLVNESALFDCQDIDGLADKISLYLHTDHSEEVNENYEALKKCDVSGVISQMGTIYLGGGLTHLQELYKQQSLRKSIGVPLDSLLLLSAGELNANKNHEIVIRALAQLNDISIHYAIAGTGVLRDYLVDLANSLGIGDQVHLLGFRDDMADLYKTADVCVFPSIREGLGLAAIEGMASGLPLICADNRGTRDYATDGENAIVCDYKDANQFAHAIQILSHDESLRIKLGRNGMEKAKKFEYKNINNMMKKIYSGI